MSELVQFFESKYQRNKWMSVGIFDLYLRKARRVLPGCEELVTCIDIANIQSDNPGSGQFPALLEQIEILANQHQYAALVIENVLTDQFSHFFKCRGSWQIFRGTYYSPCFFMKLRNWANSVQ